MRLTDQISGIITDAQRAMHAREIIQLLNEAGGSYTPATLAPTLTLMINQGRLVRVFRGVYSVTQQEIDSQKELKSRLVKAQANVANIGKASNHLAKLTDASIVNELWRLRQLQAEIGKEMASLVRERKQRQRTGKWTIEAAPN